MIFQADATCLKLLGTGYVDSGIGGQSGDLLRSQGADDASRAPDDQGAIRDDLSFGNQGVGTDQAIFANDGVIQNDGTDADQRT